MRGAADAAKVGLLVFLAALLQATIFAGISLWGGAPDLLLVALVAIALLRGPVVGASAGFLGGLVLDTATLETLGVTSLLLTIAGYWIGRYGETTGRDRAHAPLLSVVVVTAVYAAGAVSLHFVLGDPVSVRQVLVDSLLPVIVANAVLAVPVYALCRRFLRAPETAGRAREVTLLG